MRGALIGAPKNPYELTILYYILVHLNRARHTYGHAFEKAHVMHNTHIISCCVELHYATL